MKLLRLEHPRTGEPAQYLLNTQINKIYQILTFTEEHRAWFIGQLIIVDKGSFQNNSDLVAEVLIRESMIILLVN